MDVFTYQYRCLASQTSRKVLKVTVASSLGVSIIFDQANNVAPNSARQSPQSPCTWHICESCSLSCKSLSTYFQISLCACIWYAFCTVVIAVSLGRHLLSIPIVCISSHAPDCLLLRQHFVALLQLANHISQAVPHPPSLSSTVRELRSLLVPLVVPKHRRGQWGGDRGATYPSLIPRCQLE